MVLNKKMKNKIFGIFGIFMVLFSILNNCRAADNDLNYLNDDYYEEDYVEDIKDYDIEIHVNKDGSMDVTENIKVNARGINILHGIYRDFPTQYANKKVLFDLQKVLLDGRQVEYSTQNIRRGVRIKIGSAKSFVSRGLRPALSKQLSVTSRVPFPLECTEPPSSTKSPAS